MEGNGGTLKRNREQRLLGVEYGVLEWGVWRIRCGVTYNLSPLKLRKPADRLGKVVLANEVSIRGSGGWTSRAESKSRNYIVAAEGVQIELFWGACTTTQRRDGRLRFPLGPLTPAGKREEKTKENEGKSLKTVGKWRKMEE